MDLEQYGYVKNYCNSFDTPAALFDGELACIYCNNEGFLQKGDKLSLRMLTPLPSPIEKTVQTMVTINGATYCARVSPFWGEFYFCEFLDVKEIITLAEYTDIYNKLIPLVGALDRNISSIWMKSTSLVNFLRNKSDFESVNKVLEFVSNINAVNSDVYNVSEYLNAMFAKKDFTTIEIYKMVKSTIDRCNSVLSNCGRSIEFIADVDEYYIFSCHRHAMVALINALQNALLYSPCDSIPLVTLSSVLENKSRYVVLRVLNDSVYFVNEKNGEKIERNFAFQRVGLGIPIIKRFVEESDGVFSLEEKDGKVLVELKIPQYIPSEPVVYLESPGFSHYKPGVPDLLEIKMNDIVYFFGKKKNLN